MGFMLENRYDAGRKLVAILSDYRKIRDPLVLALPRGGVPVGYEVARELRAELDILIVRKLSVPFRPELAMGAIASGGARVFDADVIHAAGVTARQFEDIVEREQADLRELEQEYRGLAPLPGIRDRTVILVDDGVANGVAMLAAVQALRSLDPMHIAVAVPVASPQAIRELKVAADDCACLAAPPEFESVGQWYRDFSQVTSEQVRELLRRGRNSCPRDG